MSSKCKTSILFYGMGTTGKTTQIGELAEWLQKRYPGTYLRLISCSSGWEPLEPYIELGWIKAIDIRAREAPLETIDRLSKGGWPFDLDDPKAVLFPTEKQEDWSKVSGIALDGLTEISEWLMYRCVDKEAAGEFKDFSGKTAKFSTEEVASKFKDGSTFYASPSRSNYGMIQNHMTKAVSNLKMLADKYICCTALERRAIDEDGTRMPLYGPDLIGKAKTANVVPWFGMALHLSLNKDGTRSMWTQSHFAEDGIPFVAVVRPPKMVVPGMRPIPRVLTNTIDKDGKQAPYGIAYILDTMEYNKELIKKKLMERINNV